MYPPTLDDVGLGGAPWDRGAPPLDRVVSARESGAEGNDGGRSDSGRAELLAGLAGGAWPAAAWGLKLAVDRGGEFGGTTGAFAAGRDGVDDDPGAARPGVLGRPVPPPLARARAAAASAALPPASGRVAPGGGVPLDELAGRLGAEPAGRLGAELAGRAGAGLTAGPEPAGAGRFGAAGRAAAAGAAGPEAAGLVGGRVVAGGAVGGATALDGGGVDVVTAGADVVVTVGRPDADADRVLVVSSRPAELSPDSFAFTSASVVIGAAPPPGIC